GDQVKWEVLKDIVPVASLTSFPMGMAVHPSLGVNNAKEFVEWARANPETANFGAPGVGGQNHFLGEQFARVAGIKLPLTPYKGTSPRLTDLVGGHIPAAVTLMDVMMKFHNEGRVRVIGTFASERSPLVPDIPTFNEQGFPIKGGDAWNAMW